MAEIIGTTAAIGSILKAVVSAGALIQGISQAPQEARQVADQIEATKAVLKCLQASLKTIQRPPEFFRLWTGSTSVVLGGIRTTIEELNGRLGGHGTTPPRIVKLTFWKRVAWPLDREEAMRLQLQLQTYLQILAITQSALMKGTAQDAESSASEVSDIMSNIGTSSTLSPSPNLRPSLPSSIWSGGDSIVVADDSASQEGTRPAPVSPNASQKRFPGKRSLGMARCELNDVALTLECKVKFSSRRRCEDLGRGSLTLYEGKTRIWIVFRPTGIEDHESRWYIYAKPFPDTSKWRGSVPPVMPDVARGSRADEEYITLNPLAHQTFLKELESARSNICAQQRREWAKSAAIKSASRMAK